MAEQVETAAVAEGVGLRTAAAHASAHIPVAAPAERVGEVWERLKGASFDSAAVIAIVEDERFCGLVTIERLLAAAPTDLIADVMDPDPPKVMPETAQERAAWAAIQHREPGLAVVDASGRLKGLIAPQSLLRVLLQEHEEDMARLGGYLASTKQARVASTEPIHRRFAHRLPWLSIGLLGAFLAAGIIGMFEGQLEAEVLVAFFVPGVVYMADAIGTQTETLVIRGLSLGIPLRRVVIQELVTGALLGLVLALLTFPTVALIWGDRDVAAAVAIAMFTASAIATVVAMALPSLIRRVGWDPAFGSGPLATVVQDLLTVTVYFAAASAIVF
jgi:magnesium transporter